MTSRIRQRSGDAAGDKRCRGALSKLVSISTVLPDYRWHLFELMLKETNGDYHLYVGEEGFEPSMRTDPRLEPNITFVHNRYLFGRRLLWQHLPLREVMRAEVVEAELNPRVLSTWLVLLLRRLARRRTLLGGHAWPRSGPHAQSERIRHLQRRLASAIVVYTETESRQLQSKMGKIPVVAAPNALYRRDELGAALPPTGVPSTFLYVGRLISTKKPDLLLRAFATASARLGPDVRLVMIGDGPERGALEETAVALGVADRVSFEGHVSEPEALRAYYADAIASVSPGYVGLSLTQSLGFGVPMLYGDAEPHAPEIEAAIEGFTARAFPSDSTDGLADGLVRFVAEGDEWLVRRHEIADWCATRYSIESMVSLLLATALDERMPASSESTSSQ